MLSEKQIKGIEWKLNVCGELYYKTSNERVKEVNRGVCQGIDYVLEQIGYHVEWEGETATVVKND